MVGQTPRFRINSFKVLHRFIESRISNPCAGDEAEVSILHGMAHGAQTFGHGFDGHIVEASPFFLGLGAKDLIQRLWDFADSVLHACILRFKCRQNKALLPAQVLRRLTADVFGCEVPILSHNGRREDPRKIPA
jgi:hypothetical protein